MRCSCLSRGRGLWRWSLLIVSVLGMWRCIGLMSSMLWLCFVRPRRYPNKLELFCWIFVNSVETLFSSLKLLRNPLYVMYSNRSRMNFFQSYQIPKSKIHKRWALLLFMLFLGNSQPILLQLILSSFIRLKHHFWLTTKPWKQNLSKDLLDRNSLKCIK